MSNDLLRKQLAFGLECFRLLITSRDLLHPNARIFIGLCLLGMPFLDILGRHTSTPSAGRHWHLDAFACGQTAMLQMEQLLGQHGSADVFRIWIIVHLILFNKSLLYMLRRRRQAKVFSLE